MRQWAESVAVSATVARVGDGIQDLGQGQQIGQVPQWVGDGDVLQDAGEHVDQA